MNPAIITALEISGIGLAGVFLFMSIFYFVIVGIDKLFPIEDPKHNASAMRKSDSDDDTDL